MALWHERDISHSSTERFVFERALGVAAYATRTLADILDGLEVDADRMRANLDQSGGMVYSEALLLAMVAKGADRQDAYRLVQSAAKRAWSAETTFADALHTDPAVAEWLSAEEIDRAMDLEHHLAADVGVRPDGAGDRAHADDLASALQALRIASKLRVPTGRLETEGDRLRVDAVAAPDHGCVPVLERQPLHDLDQPGQLSFDDARRVAQHDRGGRVEDVGAGQPVVQPAPLRSQPLRDRAQERDDVVLRLSLDLVAVSYTHLTLPTIYSV